MNIRLCTLICFLSAGCASIVQVGQLTKDSKSGSIKWTETGIPYYLPKPYLVIAKNFTPIGEAGTNSSCSKSQSGKSNSPPANAEMDLQSKDDNGKTPPDKFSYQVVYLPDTNQLYSIRFKRGSGTFSSSVNLLNGWMLSSVNMQNDAKTAETIQAVTGSLKDLEALAKDAATAAGRGGTSSDAVKAWIDRLPFAQREEFKIRAGVWICDLTDPTYRIARIWPEEDKQEEAGGE